NGDNNFSGAGWIWKKNSGGWSQQGSKLVGSGAAGPAHQGISVAISSDGTTAIIGGPFDNASVGAAWIWVNSNGVWTQQGQKLVGSDGISPSLQGYSVALSADGNTALVGGWYDNSAEGAAWIWTRSGGVWTQQGSKLVSSGSLNNAAAGVSVALSAD